LLIVRRLFLSYNSRDESLALAVKKELESSAWSVFFAPWSLRAGAYWMPELAAAIRECDAFVLLAANAGLGPWQVLEYYEAMDRHAKDAEFPLIPALIGGIQPDAPFLRSLHWLNIASDQTAGLQIAAALGNHASPEAASSWRYLNPYRGLHAFRETDADFYFGREILTRQIIAEIQKRARIVLLLGNSGVGKSSLMQAGVVAALRRQRMPDREPAPSAPWPLPESRSWLYLWVRPEENVFSALARAFVS
jgi:TIR domain